MRQIFLALVGFVFLGAISITTTQAQDWSEERLQNMYMDFLSDEGIEGWVDSDGDVQFEYDDRNYFIEVNEDDNEFFRVVLFNIWPIESNSESVEAAFACNEVNTQMKVTKAYITNDNVWIACELFVGRPDQFKPVFTRCLKVIDEGRYLRRQHVAAHRHTHKALSLCPIHRAEAFFYLCVIFAKTGTSKIRHRKIVQSNIFLK